MPQLGHRRLRRFFDWLVRLRGSPQEIARGVAIGMIVAFTPTVGFQIVLTVGLATLFGANRPVAVLPTGLTNPLTIPPVYGFTYWVGSAFWPGPAPGRVSATLDGAASRFDSLDFLAVREQLGVFLELGVDVFLPLWIGGLLVGGVAAAVSYPLTLRTVTRLRARRRRRKTRSRRKRSG